MMLPTTFFCVLRFFGCEIFTLENLFANFALFISLRVLTCCFAVSCFRRDVLRNFKICYFWVIFYVN